MNQLQTVLDALNSAGSVRGYEEEQRYLNAIEIVKQMMQAEPVGYVTNTAHVFLREPSGFVRMESTASKLFCIPIFAAPQAVPALDESEVEDLARSAFESAMSFGIDFNSYERLAKHIWKKMLPAAPKGEMK